MIRYKVIKPLYLDNFFSKISTNMFGRVPVTLLRNYHAVSNFKNSFDKTCIRIKTVQRSYSNVVVVIGGGAMGASVAYWLKEKAGRSNKDIKVTVIEKDFTYSACSTVLSVGGIRQQFSVPENIKMSQFGAEFIKNIKNRFGPEADISYQPNGYLILASENGAQKMQENFKLQQELGVNNQLLTKQQLKNRFAWINVSDVELACLGSEKEGWFDPWGLLFLLKRGATDKGAKFIQGEIVNFVFGNNNELQGIQVRLPNNKQQTIPFDQCVLAAGAESGNIAKLAKIGTESENLSVPLPVERRKRYVYRFDSQGDRAPEMNTPIMIDYSGVYFRRDGGSYIGGSSPKPEDEPRVDNLDVDFGFFDRCVWPILAHRVPAFESLKIKSAWGGYYEYNTFDENGIIGAHPHHKNLYIATGFSGHGIQQSPAVGLAVAELMLDGRFSTIDLTRMGFNRLITQKPVYETEIY